LNAVFAGRGERIRPTVGSYAWSFEERRNAMQKNYQSPEAVEMGSAEEVILGAKTANVVDSITMDFPPDFTPSVVDVD
jgi:hypothetical protein